MCTYAVRTGPFPFWSLLQLGLETDEMVGAGTRVTQDDLPSLLTHLAVILVVSLQCGGSGQLSVSHMGNVIFRRWTSKTSDN